MAAEGRVIVGFSKPYVALYSAAGGAVTYNGGRRLARGVSVSLDIETSDDNDFYADNEIAESESGTFSKGNVKLGVDGLHQEAERMVYGIPEPTEETYGESKKVEVTKHGDAAQIPYLGIGYIVQYKSAGISTWEPTILRKAKFKTQGTEAKTKEKETSWQSQTLEATLHRDDTAEHDWKWVMAEQTTEEEADAILRSLLKVAEQSEGA